VPVWQECLSLLLDRVAIRFEWDPAKALRNLLVHRVRFDEAESVFGDPLSRTIVDPYSWEERRFATIGMSQLGRLLVVVHADRGDTMRIISARIATSSERRSYEKKDDA
jgi:uncharacterized DUF497 family protein